MDMPVMSTLISFAKICSDKKEEPLFNGNKELIKKFFENREEKFVNRLEYLSFNEEFDHLIIAHIVYPRTFEINSPYLIPEKFANLYYKIEDKKTFDEIGKMFYEELKYN